MTASHHILLADDEETFLLSTAQLLADEGFSCTVARGASEAIALVDEIDFDVVVADIKMPGNPNLEFVTELSTLARRVPVILVTGYPSLETAIRAVKLPVAAYLVKPVDFDELLREVRAATHLKSLSRAVSRKRERLEREARRLGVIEDHLGESIPPDTEAGIHGFLDLTFENMLGGMADVRRLTEALSGGQPEAEPCQLLNCPRYADLRGGLVDAVRTIESTRSAFKSRALADLRARLETTLEAMGG